MKALKSSVHKTFAVLEYFTNQKPEWGVTELAKAMDSNKSTVYRFLKDMQSLGILIKNPNSEKYSLGLKLYELGSRVQLKSAFVDKTHPVLEEVAQSIKETVHIAVLKNHRVFYVDKAESPQGLKTGSHIGTYHPAYATSLGKILLAFLAQKEQEQALKLIFNGHPLTAFTDYTLTSKKSLINELNQIKSNGYAIDREEFEIGLICVGIPIFNQNNEVVASLSASGPANRFKEEEVLNYVAILKEGADTIREKIGFFKP